MTSEIGFWNLKNDNTKTLIWIGVCLGIVSYVMAFAILIFGPFGGRWECAKYDWNTTWYVDCHAPYSGVRLVNGTLWVDYDYCGSAPRPCIVEVFVRDVK